MLFSLKGCGSVDSLFRKKYLILLSLSKFLTGSRSSCDVLLGIKFSPSERTSSWGVFRILEERLVMYFLRLVCLWVSFWICLRVVFLEFLLAYILGYFRGHEFILRILLLEIFIDKFDVEYTEVGVV